MKREIVIFMVFLFYCETMVFSQGNTTWGTLEFKNYTISYPLDKHMTKNSQEGTFTLYLNSNDNITMEINDLSGYNLSLSEFSRQYIENLQSKYNMTILQNIRATINNQPCQKIIFTLDDGHGEIKIKSMHYILVKNNWAYMLEFTCSPSKFNELKPIAQKVMDSFKITK